MFKIYIDEKVERLKFLTSVAEAWVKHVPTNKFFELNNTKKALKIYLRIQRYYRNKDAKNNFLEEDPDTLAFRDASDQIEAIHLSNFCRYA